MSFRSVSGVLAASLHHGERPPPDLLRRVEAADLPPLRPVQGAWLSSWGYDPVLPTADRPLLLSGPALCDGALVKDIDVAQLLRDGAVAELGRLMPPFGAIGVGDDGLRIAVDRMAFRQVFWCRGDGWDAASTSARLLGRLLGRGWDEEGVLVQSQVGWQLGQRTLYRGVTKLAPGESLLLTQQRLCVEQYAVPRPRPGSADLDDAVDRASTALRGAMGAYLDHAAEPLFQLSGGMDSRLVLSSAPAARRHALHAVTIDVPGSADAAVARAVADRCGLRHRLVSLDGLAAVPAAEWFERVLATAASHDAMLDPVAKAATDWAEESLFQGNRVGGVGGEVGRGFYYAGRVRPSAVTRRRSDRLARWKVLANEAVQAEALHARYRVAAGPAALDAVHTALVEADDEWFSATDELYYAHRMTRWAGLADSVASTRRRLMNPLLHPGYVEVVQAVSPRDKAHTRFMGRLQMALDPQLGRIPLEGRPSPEAFAHPGVSGRTQQAVTLGRRVLRKAGQRAKGARRPPAGGVLVASGVVDHLRAHPALAEPLSDCGWFDADWLGGVLDATVQPQPHTVAFMMNVLVGLESGDEDT